ncbi:MAG: hypothetical protein ABSA23_11745 [Anaerolineales bacterium]|jgi:hypothetical protein
MNAIPIGHLLHSSTTQFTAGCAVAQLEAPAFGALVRAPLDQDYGVYGLIYDIHIDEDGLVRQLVTAGNISPEVMRDNRERRIVPVEMSVLTVGYEQDGKIFHMLPPRPPLSLDVITLCSEAELARFTGAGAGPEPGRRDFGYFRHILQAKDIPVGEVLAAHILQVKQKTKNDQWVGQATRELITLLRDDYPTLMGVLGALGEVV